MCRSERRLYEGGEGEKNIQAENPEVRTLSTLEFDPIQADRLERTGLERERGNENLEAKYLKGITGVWGILRPELAHERIICIQHSGVAHHHMKHLEKFRHGRLISFTLKMDSPSLMCFAHDPLGTKPP